MTCTIPSTGTGSEKPTSKKKMQAKMLLPTHKLEAFAKACGVTAIVTSEASIKVRKKQQIGPTSLASTRESHIVSSYAPIPASRFE